MFISHYTLFFIEAFVRHSQTVCLLLKNCNQTSHRAARQYRVAVITTYKRDITEVQIDTWKSTTGSKDISRRENILKSVLVLNSNNSSKTADLMDNGAFLII